MKYQQVFHWPLAKRKRKPKLKFLPTEEKAARLAERIMDGERLVFLLRSGGGMVRVAFGSKAATTLRAP
jgi:hypothetical protein